VITVHDIDTQPPADPRPAQSNTPIHVTARHTKTQQPAEGRVAVDMGPPDVGIPGARAILTPAQARRLARRLWDEAARAELGDRALVATGHGTIEVDATGHSAWCATADGRHLYTTAGGPFGMAPTGAELLVAAAAVCAAARIGEFLEERGMSRRQVEVHADYDTCGQHPARVSAVRLNIGVHAPLSLKDREAVRDVLNRCTVVSSLQQPPRLVINLSFRGGT
jgi:uncharacterized OsmC-like protein